MNSLLCSYSATHGQMTVVVDAMRASKHNDSPHVALVDSVFRGLVECPRKFDDSGCRVD